VLSYNQQAKYGLKKRMMNMSKILEEFANGNLPKAQHYDQNFQPVIAEDVGLRAGCSLRLLLALASRGKPAMTAT